MRTTQFMTARGSDGRLQFTAAYTIRSHPKRPAQTFSWDTVSDAELSKLAQEFTAKEIGEKLGCSRSAVIGRCSRRGIALCGRSGVVVDPQRRAEARRERERLRYHERRGARPPKPPEPAVPTDYTPLGISILALRSGSCRWPLWRAAAAPADKLYCGNPALPGQPYCSHCRALSIAPRHTKDMDRRLNLSRLARAA